MKRLHSFVHRLGPVILVVALLPASARTAAQDASVRSEAVPAGFPWLAAPARAAGPCPSRFEVLEAPESCVFGTRELATTRPAVIDGDTIRLEGEKESLRLIGLDCEETFKDAAKKKGALQDFDAYLRQETEGKDAARPPKYATFMGEAAKDFARQFFAGVKEVRVEWDDPARKLDGFGRHLVLVLKKVDGGWINFNIEVVRQGLSPYYVKYGRSARYHAAFVRAQEEAQAEKRGIWGEPGPYRHYPDYAARLLWWSERDLAIHDAEALRRTREDVFLLGQEAEWNRLLGMEGKTVTVFGSPGDEKVRGAIVLRAFPHALGLEFNVVGQRTDLDRLDFKKEEGNLLYVTGVLELYKGKPQFRADAHPVRVSRKPPA